MVKINKDALDNLEGKQLFLVTEQWQGLSPATSYKEQADAVSRALDSVEYIERAVERGDVVMAHKPQAMIATMQVVAVDHLEQLSGYLKSNEAHARLPNTNRTVQPLSDWDASVESFNMMLARAEVRARFEEQGLAQPSQMDLETEAQSLLQSKSQSNPPATK